MLHSTGTVYKIICTLDSDIVYIGSTFNSLRQRWQIHKGCFKRYLEGKDKQPITIYPYFEKYGIENFKILKIKKYSCYRANMTDHRHLQAYEQLWINKTKNCVNKQSCFSIPVVEKQRMKEYRKANIEKISEKNKKHYEKNKERILQRTKEYKEKNKERILQQGIRYYEKNKERLKEKVECEICKVSMRKDSLTRHKKSKKHLSNIENN
jgi:hypothetical protein